MKKLQRLHTVFGPAERPSPKTPRPVSLSQAMRKLEEQICQVARVDTPVMLVGEAGTEKERVARAIHQRSRRQAGPFVALNCASGA